MLPCFVQYRGDFDHGVTLPAFLVALKSLSPFLGSHAQCHALDSRCCFKAPCASIKLSARTKSDESDEDWRKELQELSEKIIEVYSSNSAPNPEFTPQDVISISLKALQTNDLPVKDSGTSVLLRFASDKFKLQLRWMIGTAHSSAVLSSSLRKKGSQYNLLLCPYDFSFPSDTYYIDNHRAFQEVQLDARPAPAVPGGATLLAKLGWEFVRGDDGCWHTDTISWHDFRDEFRPGHGQEEWPRICG